MNLNLYILFKIGNGRMGRMWQTLILSEWNSIFEYLPMETIIKENQKDYYNALETADKNADSTNFIEFMLDIIRKTLKNLKNTEQAGEQVTEQVKRIMKIIEGKELTGRELMEQLNLKHRPTFRDNYLIPAIKLGLIEMTIPDKPNSNKQKYRKALKR